MRYPRNPRHGHLKDVRPKIEAALRGLAPVTRETAEKTIRNLLPSGPDDVSTLVPFTGYYGFNTVNDNPTPGAYLGVDTSWTYVTFPIVLFPFEPPALITVGVPAITVWVSLNGSTPSPYPFEGDASFDGTNLKIPTGPLGPLSVALVREYQAGQLVNLSGSIGSSAVTGSTYFNPVELPVFTGTYTNVATGAPALTLTSSSALAFDSGSGLQLVPVFTYNPQMYVVEFDTYVLMLGTAPGLGLACFILDTADPTKNGFAVTIPPS